MALTLVGIGIGLATLFATARSRSGARAIALPPSKKVHRLQVGSAGVLICLVLALLDAERPEAPPANRAEVAGDLADVARVAALRGARLHLDIAHWDFVWPRVVALQLANARAEGDRMCVATRWHVLFTEAARCRSGHSTSGGDDGRPNIRVEAKTNEAGQPVGLNFVEFEPGIGDGTWFRAGEAGDHDVALVLAGGWSSIEAGRVWSNKPSSSLVFEAPPRTAFVLHIEVETSLGASRPDVEASVSVNGEAQALWTFNQTNNGSIREVRLLPSEDGRYTVEFSVDSLASARKLGLGDDRRQVGIALGRIDVAAAP